MDIFTSFATDDNAEVNGVWQKGSGDSEFLIARALNRKYQRELAKLIEENQEALERKDEVADKTSDDIMAKVYARTILLGWRGAVTYQGEAITYSVENAEKLLKHKEFRKWVAKKSEDLDAYRAKMEAAQGNG